MRLGLGSFAFAWSIGVPGFPGPSNPLTPAGLLDAAARLGVRVVQIADNLPLEHWSDPALDELARQARDLGLTLELGTRGIHLLPRQLEIATRLGSTLLRVVVDRADDHPPIDLIETTLRSLTPDLASRGVTLAVENHDRFKARTLAALLNRIGHPRVGLCFDTANSLGCMEGAEQVFETLAPYVVNLHLKDVIVRRQPHNFGFVVEGRPAGQGQLEIPDLLQRLGGPTRNLSVIIELWPSPEPTPAATIEKEVAWVRQSVDYLRPLLPT